MNHTQNKTQEKSGDNITYTENDQARNTSVWASSAEKATRQINSGVKSVMDVASLTQVNYYSQNTTIQNDANENPQDFHRTNSIKFSKIRKNLNKETTAPARKGHVDSSIQIKTGNPLKP